VVKAGPALHRRRDRNDGARLRHRRGRSACDPAPEASRGPGHFRDGPPRGAVGAGQPGGQAL